MLKPNVLANKIEAFIVSLSTTKQTDYKDSIKRFSQNLEKDIYEAILSVDIIIPPGTINVVGSQGPSSNVAPITIKLALK